MALYYGNNKIKHIYYGDVKLKKLYNKETKIWSGASLVSYVVDTDNTVTQEVDEGMTILSPSFSPTKSGYVFLGWREDTVASSSVLSTKVATGEPMTVYAVFKKDITVTKYNGSISASTETKQQYYNNGNITNPTFTLSENALSGWSKAGWTTNASGYNATVADGSSITLSSNATYYSLYTQTVYMGWVNNYESTSIIAESKNRIANYHSSLTYSHPVFSRACVVSQYNWSIVGWGANDSAITASYASGANVTVSSGTGSASSPALTLYAIYRHLETLTYYNNSSSASTKQDYAYVTSRASSASWRYYYPTVTLSVTAVSGWSIRGWSTSSGATAAISYNSGAAIPINAGTLYSSWSRTVTVSYNGNGHTGGSTAASTGIAYRNYAGTVSAASISLRANGFAKTSYTFYRWALNSASGTQYKAGATISSSTDVTMYANWIVTETSFNYTGGMQSFTMLAGVTYLLQVYGAQGGSVNRVYQIAVGGKGAYAYGYKSYSSNTTVYIGVGGKGATASSGAVAGGYNGGGSSYDVSDHAGGGGGGATHIGLSNAILKSTASNNVLIVAGGGGGAGGNQSYGSGAVAAGGGGGGTNGDAGSRTINWSGGACVAGQGGTQSGAGSGSEYQIAGGYGQGASYNPTYYTLAGGAGGGGWYGGGMGYGSQVEDRVNAAGGGGGSGYIGGVSNGGFLNGYWPDNGFAKITVSSVA